MPPRPIQRMMPLDLKRQQVEITIKDQFVTTAVTQVFKNPTSQRFEGTFLFPVPKGAQVKEFAMEVNGEIVNAELLDAKKARQIYEDIVRRALDPALFEYAGRELFKVRIFPIEPHSEKEVRIRYTELLPKDGQVVRYAYPLNTSKYNAKEIENFSMKVTLEAGEGKTIKTIYSPSHEIEISRKDKQHAVLGLEAAKMGVERDFQLYYSLAPAGDNPVMLHFLTYHENAGDPGHFMLLLSPDVWSGETKAMPKDVVFVFDSSGSMRGPKMDQARAAMKFCIENLNAEDRFEVIRFSTEAEPVFEEMAAATQENRKRALEFVKGVQAIGGTAIEEALTLGVSTAAKAAKENRPVQIIFLTDGLPTLGATKEDVILSKVEKAMGEKAGNVRVFCFGIGTDINTHLLDLITEKTRAVSQYVLPDENIEDKVSRFYAKISDPVLTGLKLKLDGAEWVRDRYPKDLPDLFRGDQLLVLGRFQGKEAKGKVTLTGVMDGKEQNFEFPVEMTKGEDNGFIAHLWATRRVGYLLDQIRLSGESEELKEEVAELARKYGIVTPYTTYLIVEDEVRRNVPAEFRTQAPAPAGAPSSPAKPSASEISADYDALTRQKEGAGAVGGASSTIELKQANRTADLAKSNEAADKARGRAVTLAPSQNVGGKTFYQREETLWVDGDTQRLPENAKRRQLKFGTAEYFDFLAANPQATQWFSVSPRLQIVVADELVEIN